MMTSEMRKETPETIQELYKENFTILALNHSAQLSYLYNTIEASKR
jgi:hypothetical protein